LKVCKKLPLLIAIPTTAGTGSETTLAAVITDEKTHFKYPINDFNLIPNYAVLDYKTTLGLPPHITSTTGMDALTHAVEAYIGRSTTKETRDMAEKAVKLIVDNIYTAYSDGKNKEARENMLKAAYYAGVAFTKSYVGYVHAVAHSLGGQYKIPHGLANAVILPYFLEEYGKTCYKKLAKLSRISGVAESTDNDEVASKKFISWIKDTNAKMNIPNVIDGIKADDIEMLAKKANSEGNPLYPVPKLMNAKQLSTMYYKIGGLDK
jgi:alcohol dehydrogenase class IV